MNNPHFPALRSIPTAVSSKKVKFLVLRGGRVSLLPMSRVLRGSIQSRVARLILSVFIALSALSALATADGAKLPPVAEQEVDFERDVLPIFSEHCQSCHGSEKQKSEYRLDVNQIALTGGEGSAPNILPGKSAESPLIKYVSGLDEDMQMPPKKSDAHPLTAIEIGLIRRWIDDGAA